MTPLTRLKCLLVGLCGLTAACSYLSEIKAQETGPAIVLDEDTLSQRTRIRVCYQGMHAEYLDLQITANASGPVVLADEDGSAPQTLSSTNNEANYNLLDQGLTFESACDTGMVVLFTTDSPAETPTISWSVEAVATQTDGEQIFEDTITVSIENLPPE